MIICFIISPGLFHYSGIEVEFVSIREMYSFNFIFHVHHSICFKYYGTIWLFMALSQIGIYLASNHVLHVTYIHFIICCSILHFDSACHILHFSNKTTPNVRERNDMTLQTVDKQ